MSPELAREIQLEQDHGRSKYGDGPEDFEHDDHHVAKDWHIWIREHNERGEYATPMDRRQHLIKVAGLAISAVESFDRQRKSRIDAALKELEEGKE